MQILAIVSTVPGGSYGTWSGTSMAAPLVAGVAALVRANDANANAPEVSARLITTAAPISGPISKRLDAAAALGFPPAPNVLTGQVPYIFLPELR